MNSQWQSPFISQTQVGNMDLQPSGAAGGFGATPQPAADALCTGARSNAIAATMRRTRMTTPRIMLRGLSEEVMFLQT
jgi:hypothetical protein